MEITTAPAYLFISHLFNLSEHLVRMICVCLTDKAPVSKSLLLLPTAFTVLLLVALPQYQKLFVYSLQAITHHRQVSVRLHSSFSHVSVSASYTPELYKSVWIVV